MKLIIYTEDGEVELEALSTEQKESLEEESLEAFVEVEYFGRMQEEAELESAGRTQRDFPLAKFDVPEFKLDWKMRNLGLGIKAKMPVSCRRNARHGVYVRVSTGKVTNDMVWKSLKSCLLTAAAGAGIPVLLAGIITGGAASIVATQGSFLTILKGCLIAKGGELAAIATDVDIDLYVKTKHTKWRC